MTVTIIKTNERGEITNIVGPFRSSLDAEVWITAHEEPGITDRIMACQSPQDAGEEIDEWNAYCSK